MASYYGVLVPRYWTGPTGRLLRDRGGHAAQLLGVYLLSNDYMNMLGIYPLKLRDVEDELGLTRAEITAALSLMRLDSVEYAYYDLGTSYVWVREMVRFRLGLKGTEPLKRDDNKAIGAQRLYASLPANPWLGPFFDRYHRQLHLKRRRDGPPADFGPETPTTSGGSSPLQAPSKPLEASSTYRSDQKRSEEIRSEDQNLLIRTDQRRSVPPPPHPDRTRTRARAAAAREGRVIFRGQRLKIHDFTLDDLRLMLGSHTAGFDLEAWFEHLDRELQRTGEILPIRDGGAWVLRRTVEEARGRGLPVAVSDPTAVIGKPTSRLLHAIANIKAEARR